MTVQKEDFIKNIYMLGGRDELVSNKDLANALHVAPASVTEMLGKLDKEGLVTYEPYKGTKLTAEGFDKSLSLIRSHRLWEVFLVRDLGYDWGDVHELAEKLEHVTPPDLALRLERYLDYPRSCPHGSSIPQPDGRIAVIPLVRLSDIEVGEKIYIRRVEDEKDLLDYLHGKGINIDMEAVLQDREPYEGSYLLKAGDSVITVSAKAASRIFVEKE